MNGKLVGIESRSGRLGNETNFLLLSGTKLRLIGGTASQQFILYNETPCWPQIN
jgi:hypothetical protein